jgi:hypothetical protein
MQLHVPVKREGKTHGTPPRHHEHVGSPSKLTANMLIQGRSGNTGEAPYNSNSKQLAFMWAHQQDDS